MCRLIARARQALRRRWLAVRVVGDSMAPALRDGQLVIARRRAPIDRGAIVVFAPPRASIGDPDDPALRIKRVAAMPGDAVPGWATAVHAQAVDGRVPDGYLVVRGDAPSSQDSRHFGLVAIANVRGIVESRATTC